MPMASQTALASLGGASWRIALTPWTRSRRPFRCRAPGRSSFPKEKVKTGGIGVLYGGAAANFAANWVGNYPWFVTFNYLQANVPKYDGVKGLARNAFFGMSASFVSDCVSNSLRVVKTIKQTNADANIGYMGAVKTVIEKDGLKDSLRPRSPDPSHHQHFAQSMVFSVFWKAIEAKLNAAAEKKNEKQTAKTWIHHPRRAPRAQGRRAPAQARVRPRAGEKNAHLFSSPSRGI